jgi:hypothetical protein
MATNDPYGQVFQGQAGTGAAFLLNGNAAADIYNSNVQRDDKYKRLEEFNRQKTEAERQQTISDNLSKLSTGEHWINHDKELNDKYKNVMDYATMIKSNGKDPFQDQKFLALKNDLNNSAQYSKQIKGDYDKTVAELKLKPNGYDNTENVLSQFTNKPLDYYVKNGWKPEQLNRSYSLADAIKASNGKVSYVKNNDGSYNTQKINNTGIVDQAIGSTDLPEAQYQIKKSGGDVGGYTQGFPSESKDGKRLWFTNDNDVEKLAYKTWQNDQSFAPYLQQKGYDISTPEKALNSAKDYIKKQNNAVGGYVKSYKDAVAGTGTIGTQKVYSADNNAMSHQRLNMEWTKFNERGNTKDKDGNTYLDELKSGSIKGSGEAINRLNSFLHNVNGQANYKNGTLTVTIPSDKNIKDAYQADIDNGKGGKTKQWFGKDGAVLTGYTPEYKNIRIKTGAGEQGDIALENVFKELGLRSDKYTPKKYGGELDNLGSSDNQNVQSDNFDNL